MKQLVVLTCLVCVAFTQETVIDPRGARPVEHGTRDEKCATQKEWPFCLDDDWGFKCPSGCRIQGLMDKYDHDLLKKIEHIRHQLNQHKGKFRSADQVSKQTHDYLREKLTVDAGHDNRYYDLAQNLRKRITEIKIRIDQQMRVMAALKARIRDQVTEMQRLEVDIDMKLRSCKGSCAGYHEYQVDRESYVTLEKQVAQLGSQSPQNIEAAGTLYVMKSRPLQDVLVDSIYKTKAVKGQQKQDLFSDIKTLKLVLEEEGSSSSPATISKEPGTSLSSSSPSSPSTSGSSNPSKSITELGGRGDGDFFGGLGGFEGFGQPSTGSVTTKFVSCTTQMKKVVVHTKDGPVERYETVTEGGPECQGNDMTKGGMSSLFPSLSHATKTGFTSGKGTILENPFGGDVGIDLGAFMTDNAEDDVPDFHARSVKSADIERQADYVGKACLRLKQQRRDGPQIFRNPAGHGSPLCSAKPSLCSDDDWVSKCPSGCRLQGLISQMEMDIDRKLQTVCEAAKALEEAAEKSMMRMTHVYNNHRRVLVNRYVSEQKFAVLADILAEKLTSLQEKSKLLDVKIKELRSSVKKQVEELYRTEVDVDILLRACGGSCQSRTPFSIDHHRYQELQSDPMLEALHQRSRASPPPRAVKHIKLQPLESSRKQSPDYKSIPMVRKELLTQFEDISLNQFSLEEKLEEESNEVE